MSEQKEMSALAETIEDSYQGQFVQDILLDESDRRLIVKALNAQARSLAQDAVACTCSQAGFPSSCYNCDAEASDIVNALRKLYSTHPICAQAANYIERKLRDMATPSEPLQCLRCGTVDAFGPAARSPAACADASDIIFAVHAAGATIDAEAARAILQKYRLEPK